MNKYQIITTIAMVQVIGMNRRNVSLTVNGVNFDFEARPEQLEVGEYPREFTPFDDIANATGVDLDATSDVGAFMDSVDESIENALIARFAPNPTATICGVDVEAWNTSISIGDDDSWIPCVMYRFDSTGPSFVEWVNVDEDGDRSLEKVDTQMTQVRDQVLKEAWLDDDVDPDDFIEQLESFLADVAKGVAK